MLFLLVATRCPRLLCFVPISCVVVCCASDWKVPGCIYESVSRACLSASASIDSSCFDTVESATPLWYICDSSAVVPALFWDGGLGFDECRRVCLIADFVDGAARWLFSISCPWCITLRRCVQDSGSISAVAPTQCSRTNASSVLRFLWDTILIDCSGTGGQLESPPIIWEPWESRLLLAPPLLSPSFPSLAIIEELCEFEALRDRPSMTASANSLVGRLILSLRLGSA